MLPTAGEIERIKKGGEVLETALVLWPAKVQLWVVHGGPLQAKHSLMRDGLRAVVPLTWPPPRDQRWTDDDAAGGAPPAAANGVSPSPPPPGRPSPAIDGAETSRKYWLVGTATDELLLLSTDLQLTSLPAGARATPSGAPRAVKLALQPGSSRSGSAAAGSAEAAPPPLGIAALSLVGGPEKMTMGKPPNEHDWRPYAELAALAVGFEDGSVRQYSLPALLAAF